MLATATALSLAVGSVAIACRCGRLDAAVNSGAGLATRGAIAAGFDLTFDFDLGGADALSPLPPLVAFVGKGSDSRIVTGKNGSSHRSRNETGWSKAPVCSIRDRIKNEANLIGLDPRPQ